MADPKVSIKISTEGADRAKRDLKGVGGSAGVSAAAIAKGFLIAKAALGVFNVAVGAVKKGFNALKGIIQEGADFKRLEVATLQLAKNMKIGEDTIRGWEKELRKSNTTGEKATKVIQSLLRSGLIKMEEGVATLGKRLDGTNITMNEFTMTAKNLAAAAGISSGKGIDALTTALQKNRPEMLESLGINLNMVRVNKDYAKSIGKTRSELTAQEESQALLNAIMKEGEKVVGTYDAVNKTAAKNLLSMDDAMDTIRKTLGVGLEPAFQAVTGVVLNFLKMFRDGVSNLRPKLEVISEKIRAFIELFIEGFSERLPEIKAAFEGLIESLRILASHFSINEEKAGDLANTLGVTLGTIVQNIILNIDDFVKSFTDGMPAIETAVDGLKEALGLLGIDIDGFIEKGDEAHDSTDTFGTKAGDVAAGGIATLIEGLEKAVIWWDENKEDIIATKKALEQLVKWIAKIVTKVSEMKKSWDDFKEAMGPFAVFFETSVVGPFKALLIPLREIKGLIDEIQGSQAPDADMLKDSLMAPGRGISEEEAQDRMANPGNYAKGGIVGGSSFSGDRIPIRVNSGEAVLTQGMQVGILKLLEKIGDTPSANKNVNFNGNVNIGGQRSEAQGMNMFSNLLQGAV